MCSQRVFQLKNMVFFKKNLLLHRRGQTFSFSTVVAPTNLTQLPFPHQFTCTIIELVVLFQSFKLPVLLSRVLFHSHVYHVPLQNDLHTLKNTL